MSINNFIDDDRPQIPPYINAAMAVPPQFVTDDDEIMDLIINYNEKFKNKSPLMFRDNIIKQVLSVIIGKDKPNALLIGPAGSGKTAIVETLGQMLENNDIMIPPQIQGYTIWELPLSNVVAGCSLQGELEQKLQAIIAKFVENPQFKGIVFIDEIHQLVSRDQTFNKMAQILKPYLARGDLKVIGATTNQEANNLMDDPAFNRRFTRIIVDELTRDQTVEILKATKPSFIQHYKNIRLDDSLLERIATIADQYKPPGSHRPDNALTLLDRTIGEAIINRNAQMKQLQTSTDPQDISLFQLLKNNPKIPIQESHVQKTAIALATGNSKKDTLNETRIRKEFSHIKGQDKICEEMINIMKREELKIFQKNAPTSILFIGPSGVGKTKMANIIAKELTGNPPITLNMTEYADPTTINRIIGSPAGYVGSDSHAELPFDPLESNPYAVILLDEFEKAHPAVKRIFFSIFDDGTLTDNHGKTLDFSKAVIIATTNAGHTTNKKSIGFGNETGDKTTIKDLTQSFDPALLNRFTHRVVFNSITKEVYREIIHDYYNKERERLRKEFPRLKIPDTLDDNTVNDMVKTTYHEEFGARPIQETVQKYIEELALATP